MFFAIAFSIALFNGQGLMWQRSAATLNGSARPSWCNTDYVHQPLIRVQRLAIRKNRS